MPGTARAIAACKLPRARRLTIYFGAENYGGNSSIADVRPLLLGKGVPALEHLGLCNAEFQDALAAAVATSPLLKRLRSLDLSRGTMRESGAEAILAHADAFAHLERLDLSDNFIPEELCGRIEAALPKVEVDTRSQDSPSVYDGERYYYVSVSE